MDNIESRRIFTAMDPELAPFKYGVDRVGHLAGILAQANTNGRRLTVAGFICPLYEIDQSKLQDGFGNAVRSVGVGDLEDFPRYRIKFDRFLKTAHQFQEALGGRYDCRVHIIMGDKGLINASRLNKVLDLDAVIKANVVSYEKYFLRSSIEMRVSFIRFSELVGEYIGIGLPLSDLVEDGKVLEQERVLLPQNSTVFKKIEDESRHKIGRGDAVYEPYGFALNYGLAGLTLRKRQTQVLIGTDSPGSYLNHLYHSFIQPEDLLVVVPK